VRKFLVGRYNDVLRQKNMLGADKRQLPKFMIVGVQKGGTTSLSRYLSMHPGDESALVKELRYFTRYYSKGLNWYRANLPLQANNEVICGDATPHYMFYPHAMERIAQDLPDAKIIAMLRNPVDRAYSGYYHEVNWKRETLSFEQAIDKEEERISDDLKRAEENDYYWGHNLIHFSYVRKGIYIEQVKRCLELFPKENVMVIESGNFFKNTNMVFKEVLDFIGLSGFELGEYKNVNKRKYPPMNPETRKTLIEYYRPYNEQLYEYLGQRFDWDK